MSPPTILLVTADPEVESAFRSLASESGAALAVAEDLSEAGRVILARTCGVLFLHVDGTDSEVRCRLAERPGLLSLPPVVAFAKNGCFRDAVLAARAGVHNYLPEIPSDGPAFRNVLRDALDSVGEVSGDSSSFCRDGSLFRGFITRDYRVLSVCSIVRRIADSPAVLVVEGERGTGKSLLVRKMHDNSVRCLGPFLQIDCRKPREAQPAEKLWGASAGEVNGLPCRAALGGTLVLDEVTEAPPFLLEAVRKGLAANASRRHKSGKNGRSDVRVVFVSSSSVDLRRIRPLINVNGGPKVAPVKVRLPALRKRVQDILPLARYFTALFGGKAFNGRPELDSEVASRLVRYSWPGNVTELRGVMGRAVESAGRGTVRPRHLPEWLSGEPAARRSGLAPDWEPLRTALEEPERTYILRTLEKTGWNKQSAAEKLGISRSTLYKKMKHHGIANQPPASDRGRPTQNRWVTVLDSGVPQ